MIGAQVGIDDKIGLKIRPRRLDEDMDLLGGTCSALGIADNPAHRITGSDRAGANKSFSRLEGNIRHPSRRGIDLIERAEREGIDLHRIDKTVAHRLHPGSLVGGADPCFRIGGFGVFLPLSIGFSCPGSSNVLGTSTNFTGATGSALSMAGAASS